MKTKINLIKSNGYKVLINDYVFEITDLEYRKNEIKSISSPHFIISKDDSCKIYAPETDYEIIISFSKLIDILRQRIFYQKNPHIKEIEILKKGIERNRSILLSIAKALRIEL